MSCADPPKGADRHGRSHSGLVLCVGGGLPGASASRATGELWLGVGVRRKGYSRLVARVHSCVHSYVHSCVHSKIEHMCSHVWVTSYVVGGGTVFSTARVGASDASYIHCYS